MLASIELKRLRLPFAVAILLVLLGVGTLLTSEYYLDEARLRKQQAQTERVAAQDRVSKSSEEEKEIRENLVHYQRLVARGMVGPENRLDLIERIAKIKTQRKLFEIRYNIEPQRPLDYPGITPAGDMDFVVSRMKLEMVLLHEEDLLNFLSDLVATGQAHVSVRRCQISRAERAGPITAAPTMRAECTVDLVTLKNAKSV